VPPGNYLVAFNPALTAALSPAIITTGGAPSIQKLTFYPGTTDRSRAELVALTAGSEARNVDFAIQTIPVFSISGRAEAGLPLAGPPNLTMLSHDAVTPNAISLSNMNTLPMQSRQEGLFEFRTIPSGTYDLYATVFAQAGQPVQSGWVTITVAHMDLPGIRIPLQPAFELHGRIVPQDVSLPANTVLHLFLADRTTLPTEVPMGSSGEFRFSNLSAGAYRLEVVLPEDAFVANLRSNVLQLPASASEPLTLSVHGRAGRITGTVTSVEGKTGADTTVVLVPEEPFRGNSMRFGTARPDETGRFTISRIAPGAYKLFAWEAVLNTAWLNPEFLSRHEAAGMPLTIDAGSTTDLRAVLLPRPE
jgi:hypothetical protein